MSKKNQDMPDKEVPEQEEVQEAAAETAQAPEAPAESRTENTDPAAAVKAAEERYMRLAAEYDNFRKRSARERDAIYGDVRADTVTKFLPVYDNLLRAIAAAPEGDPVRKGVEMTLAQFETVLTKLGVTPIEALGQKFDPTVHNAVMHTEDPDVEESIVVEEFEKGFKMGDKVIRFSMVKVAN